MFLHVWEGRRQVTFLGNGVSDQLGFLGSEGEDLILDAVAACRGDWDLCDLQDLHSESPLLKICVPAPLRAEICPQYACSVVPLPTSVDEFREGLPHGLRRNLRRYRKQLDELGSVEFETGADSLDALFELHRARWALRDDRGMLDGPCMEGFHRRAAGNLLAAGMVRLHSLRLSGKIAAVVYALVHRRRAYSYLGGFDPALARFSPGALIMQYTMEQAILEGVTEFDFLRGEERYKADWGAQPYVTSRLRIWPA